MKYILRFKTKYMVKFKTSVHSMLIYINKRKDTKHKWNILMKEMKLGMHIHIHIHIYEQDTNLIIIYKYKWVVSLNDRISLYFASAFPFSLQCVRHAQVAFQRKSKMTLVACSTASFNEVSYRMWAGLQWCHAPNIVNQHIIWLISNLV